MTYEELASSTDAKDVDIVDKSFMSEKLKGLYCDGTIALNSNLSSTEKNCILAEELGHHHTSSGNIIDMNSVANRKQEHRARVWGYNRLIGLAGIISSYKAGCRTIHDTAEYLEVTNDFLTEALQYYKQKYGICTEIDNYVIYFEPSIGVFELR